MRIFVKGQVSPKPHRELLPSGRLSPTEDVICLFPRRAALSDGAGGTGVYAHLWAQQLAHTLPEHPFTDNEALWQYVQRQEAPFLQKVEPLAATHAPTNYKLWIEGSSATLAALWWRPLSGRMVAEWVSYGDSAVMIYEPRLRRLHLQPYLRPPDQFLRNPHLLNWNGTGLPPSAFCRSEKPLPLDGKIVWLASDALAQHLYWLYLSTTHWGEARLSSLLPRYPEAAPLVAALLTYSKHHRFDQHLAQLKIALQSPETFQRFCHQLHQQELLRRDDYALVWVEQAKTQQTKKPKANQKAKSKPFPHAAHPRRVQTGL